MIEVVEIVVPASPALVEAGIPSSISTVEVVERGTQGPAGPSGASGYDFIQSTTATSWTVNHNLGHRPLVTVYSVGGLEIEAEVAHISNNQTVISFVTPTAGSARFV